MTGIEMGLLGLGGMLTAMALRVPIAVAMLATGIIGYALVAGLSPVLSFLKTAPYSKFSTYSLAVIPLFLLMGEFATRAGLSRALFRAANAWLGHHRGGVAMAAIGGCAGFGSICGSSLATGATMSQVALPEMRRYRYSGRLSTASLACGGTLGILIPPSVILIIYAILTEQSIGQMFIAALLPAALAITGYCITIALIVRRHPDDGPAGPRVSLQERLTSLKEIWAVLMIFALVIGGIYRGWFTPSEAAAIGAFATGVLAVGFGGLRLKGLMASLYATARTSAMIFLILLGAELFNSFLALTQLPTEAARLIGSASLSPYLVLIAILLLYLVLGAVMDSMSMIMLTIPIFFPIIMALDFGLPPHETAIWFGIIALIVVEIGLITPPVGLNVYVINSFAKETPLLETFKGVIPFLAADIVRVGLLIAFPAISLVLVRWLF